MPEILDLHPIFTGEKKTISHTFAFMPEWIDADITVEKPLTVSVTVYEKASAGSNRAENLVECTLSISGEYKTACARCLKALTLPIDMSSTAFAAEKAENDGEDGILIAPDGKLDLTDAAETLFFMQLPSKHLCREDCKGLCPGCGADLNVEKCTCTKKNIDPRLAVLQKYLDKSEN